MMSLHFSFPSCFSSHHTKKPFSSSTHSCLLKFRMAKGSMTKCAASEIDNKITARIELPEGLESALMPKHVAVIMDGNRRWAKSRDWPVQLGHVSGVPALKQLALNCNKFGVKVLSIFAFSAENWTRPKEEVDFLMSLFRETIQLEIDELMKNDVRASIVGNISRLPKALRRLVSSFVERSKDNKGLHLVIALNYSGRYDITEASRIIVGKVKAGVLEVEDIDETLFEQHLETNGIEFPNPDLLIRTSGELRINNFMLWQLAYTELLFVDKMFPDFDKRDLVEALTVFQQRQRRYGGHKY